MSANLPWVVLFSPLVAVLVILLVTRKQRKLSAFVSVAAVAVSFIASLLIFNGPDAALQFPWINLGDKLTIPFGYLVNPLTKTMLIVVTAVGLLVHVYSLGYMKEERDMARYFGGLSLFMFSMLGIVLADNLVMVFIFWELVGVSSFLLIGHWYERAEAADAANKAFLVNRIGDFGFMLGILMLWLITGQIEFTKLEATLGKMGVAGSAQFFPYLTIATLALFCGPMGKSAQVPLHVWLPDAMEGPTPVSALIHAATMVAAGVYLLVRIGFLLEIVPIAREVIAYVGIITAVLAALMATQQNDIKRILAYSTLSQLGYMVCAVGLAAGEAAMFHLFTHAFFKALLFLGAGAVIYGMHHEQDIWKMGGLNRKMPITFVTFLVGTLALMGCPFLSGFYSKDAILVAAQSHPVICGLGLFTAFLTAFYMTRLLVVVFINKPLNEAAKHAHEVSASMSVPLLLLMVPAIGAGWGPVARIFGLGHEHEAVARQLGPIPVPTLAVAAFLLGLVAGLNLYSNKTRDPIRVALLKHKFYFDEFYARLVRYTQDALANGSAWVDRWIIDGLGVRGLTGATFGTGFILRFLQVGNLQAYAFFFGIGVILLVYLAILN